MGVGVVFGLRGMGVRVSRWFLGEVVGVEVEEVGIGQEVGFRARRWGLGEVVGVGVVFGLRVRG